MFQLVGTPQSIEHVMVQLKDTAIKVLSGAEREQRDAHFPLIRPNTLIKCSPILGSIWRENR